MQKQQYLARFSCGVGVVLVLATSSVRAASYTLGATGDWGTNTIWSPNGVPGVNDSIALNNGTRTVTVSTAQQFGGTGITSSWVDSGGFISINSGITLTHNAGGTFNHNAANGSGGMSGAGIFRNLGKFTETRNGFDLNNTVTFQNEGRAEIAGAYNCGFNVTSGAVFRNLGATIAGSGTGQGRGIAGAGSFTTLDSGSTLHQVIFDIPTGYTLPVSTSGTGRADISGSSNVVGKLELNGLGTQWSGTVNGTGAVNLQQFKLGGNLTLNTTGSGGFGNSTLVSDLGGFTLNLGSQSLSGIDNAYDFTWQNGKVTGGSGSTLLLSRGNSNWKMNSLTVEHAGTMEFRSWLSYVDYITLDASSTFRVLDGAVYSNQVRAGAGNPRGEFRGAGTFTTAESGGALHSVKLLVDAAAGLNFVSTGVGRADVAATSNVAGDLFINSGTQWSGTVNGSGRFSFRQVNLGGNFAVNLTGTGNYNNATCDYGGYKLTLGAGYLWSEDHDLTWKNGTLEIGSGATVSYDRGNGNLKFDAVTVNNYGTFQFRPNWTATATVQLNNGSVFNNYGTVTKLDNSTARDTDGGLFSSGTFNNYGTVQVLDEPGTSTLTISSAIGQISSGTLSGGTWKAAGAGTTLSLSGGNIATIGNGATVVLEDTGTINTVNAALTTVNGAFTVNGSSVFTDASGFAVGATGTLGGSGTVAANVTLNSGTVNLSGGTISGTLAANGGTWSGTGTVSGLTSVSAGTTYTVSGTQAGGGTVNGTVTAAGAKLAPGTSPGTLTVGTLGLDGASVLTFELGDSLVPGASDRIVTTNLTLDGTLNIAGLSGFGIPAGAGFARYTLLSYQSLAADGGLLLGTYPPASFNYVLGQTTGVGAGPGEVFLIIPEPATGGLLAIAALAWLGQRRRNRR